MPTAALINGLAMAPLFLLFFLLLLWSVRPRLAALLPLLRHNYSVLVIIALLTLWALMTAGWSIIPATSVVTALRAGALFLLALAGATLAGAMRPIYPVTKVIPAIGIALATLLLLAEALSSGGPLLWLALARGADGETYVFKELNRGLCALAVLTWPAALWLRTGGYRRAGLLLPLLPLPGLLTMDSLSAQMGWLAGASAFYGTMLMPRLWPRLLRATLPLAFAAWPFLFHIAEPQIRAQWYERLPPSAQHRVEIWHFAYEKWQENPLLGWGADSSRAIPGGEDEIAPRMAKLPLHPHNMPLQILLEQGLIGLALWTAALWVMARAAPPLAMAALAAFATISLSAFGMWQAWWLCTGLTAWLMVAAAPHRRPAT